MRPTTYPKKSSILYQNKAKTVILLDLPLSISNAQSSASENTWPGSILSCVPLAQPYPSTEPKSDVAKANVLERLGDVTNDQCYRNLVREGIDEIKNNYEGAWCLPRVTTTLGSLQHKRKHSIDIKESSPGEGQLGHDEPSLEFNYVHKSKSPLLLSSSNERNDIQDFTEVSQRVVSNMSCKAAKLHIPSTDSWYQIPSKAAFFLSNINEDTALMWSEAVLKHFSTPTATAGPGQFGFILLDPPWDNRSVRRSQKYHTRRKHDPMPAITEVLGKHIAPNGFVACWVTNKTSSRDAIIESFRAWGVRLVEEWIWLKVTSSEQPVYDIDGLWRKPYEILLLGRMVGYEEASVLVEDSPGFESSARRLIVAVPDLHSRKPCLKELLEQTILDARECRVLEIFARNLVQGWWSWGNEALKYNWEGCWSKAS